MHSTERYSRQILFSEIGEEGQERLANSRVVIVGCGALGAVHAEMLARAGVGTLVLVDRDFVEPSNLQRQLMYDEHDALERLPKSIAAARHLAQINSSITVEPLVADLNFENAEEVMSGADLILDGTDNFETRFLINDVAVKQRVPWIYGAAVGSYGITMTIVPSETPCLACVLEEMPQAGSGPTCDTAGVIMPAVSFIASIQAAEALKLLVGRNDRLHRMLIRINLWDFSFSMSNADKFAGTGNCRVCDKREFAYLRGSGRQVATTLCGRNAVQISQAGRREIDLAGLAARLRSAGEVAFNEFLLRFRVEDYDITVFRDARSIIRGTSDAALARSLYARYIGV
ncbi:MAG TPA: ThiF family adenylyltransferase [Blastocatellia bacterium]|nr:ThiF family adenylyltransferase [Blastocatellia bacterium]